MNDRRGFFRKNLSTLYQPYYDALCEALPPTWQPYSGFRTIEEQTTLFNKGRIVLGDVVTRAKGGESAHNYGCASDWTLWTPDQKPIWMSKEDPAWLEYLGAIAKVGLRPGVEFNDVNHNELRVACDWKHVCQIFNRSGMKAAQQHIEENLIQ